MKNTIKTKKKKTVKNSINKANKTNKIKTDSNCPFKKQSDEELKLLNSGWLVDFKDLVGVIKEMETQASEKWLYDFAVESNHIEGIKDKESHVKHKKALSDFLNYKKLSIKNVEQFVIKVAGKKLRSNPNDMVMIAGRVAPKPEIMLPLFDELLEKIQMGYLTPYEAHFEYEYLHPFMDGNGRSGRAIWLWQMVKFRQWHGQRSFLHEHYYQSLSHLSKEKEKTLKRDYYERKNV